MDIAAGAWDVFLPTLGVKLDGVETAEPNLEQDTTEIDGLNGVRYRRTRIRSADVVLTVFGTAIPNLKKILPSNWLANATQIEGQPAGVEVANEGGAITYGRPQCGQARILIPIQLVPCDGANEHTITFFDGYAEITGMPLDDGVLKFEITVTSEAVGVQVAKGAVVFPDESPES